LCNNKIVLVFYFIKRMLHNRRFALRKDISKYFVEIISFLVNPSDFRMTMAEQHSSLFLYTLYFLLIY
jgi:hypothetical protein